KIASIGEKDPVVIKEYEEAKSRLQSLETQLSDIEITMDDILQSVQALHVQMKENFQTQFTRIQQSFTENFTKLFGGGKAEIVSVPDGVDIIIAPPKKRPRHVALLSGGEKTLTSLALIFAILDVQKPPFIVLDEVDAALDEANSKRFASLLSARSHTTQSIVISHNRETMSVADVLYGVTMHSDGTSHLYSVKLEDIANMPAETPRMQV
ncbi:MAG TPA: chromosome segregation protein SMC, partial [Candidatus Andersenbacteria bacterium]|nr:chromosome segregation protein SMC [Candidatus Andersenbacteria bacterium]